MNQVIFVVDESGAKGYSTNTENEPGDLGVMAGYLIPKNCLSLVKSELDIIRSNFTEEGKIHITDLSPRQQGELRNIIFNYFIQRKIHWVYEAIYVQGYFENAESLNQLAKKAYDSRRSNIKIEWKEIKDSLHSELFQGAFGKALAFCIDQAGSPLELSVITDRTDESIIKKFKSAADTILSIGKEKIYEAKGFNIETKEVVKGNIAINISSDIDSFEDFAEISYSIACEDSSLTLAADVLVNSVHHHLKSLQSKIAGAALNTAYSITNHQLSSLVYGVLENSEGNDFSDAMFTHPIQKSRRNQ